MIFVATILVCLTPDCREWTKWQAWPFSDRLSCAPYTVVHAPTMQRARIMAGCERTEGDLDAPLWLRLILTSDGSGE